MGTIRGVSLLFDRKGRITVIRQFWPDKTIGLTLERWRSGTLATFIRLPANRVLQDRFARLLKHQADG